MGEEIHPFYADEERKRQKRIKRFRCIGIFIIFQIIVITILALTVMKVKSPKIRLGDIYVQSLSANPAASSFDISFATQIRVRNPNWGSYKYEAGTVTFMYAGLPVGQAYIPEGKAKMRSTKRVDVMVSLSSASLPANTMLGSEMSGAGVVMLSSTAQVTGKVEVMLILKKRKAAEMECALVFSLVTKTIQSLMCE